MLEPVWSVPLLQTKRGQDMTMDPRQNKGVSALVVVEAVTMPASRRCELQFHVEPSPQYWTSLLD